MDEKSDIEKMGLYIAKLRKAAHLTQRQLGDMLDRSDKTISKWERGTIAPDITLLVPLSDALNTTVADILSGGEMSKEQPDEDPTVSGIKLYTKIQQKKLSKIFIILLMIIIAFFGTALYFNNYYKWDVYDISSENKDIYINAYISKNRKSMKFIVNSFTYMSYTVGTVDEPVVNLLKFTLLSNNNEIWTYEVSFNDYILLHNALDMTHMLFESDKAEGLKKDSLSLIINFFDKNGKEYEIKIPLKYK